MITFVLSLAVILLAGLGLAIGVLMGRAPVKGSCGGLACRNLGDCAACPRRNRSGTTS